MSEKSQISFGVSSQPTSLKSNSLEFPCPQNEAHFLSPPKLCITQKGVGPPKGGFWGREGQKMLVGHKSVGRKAGARNYAFKKSVHATRLHRFPLFLQQEGNIRTWILLKHTGPRVSSNKPFIHVPRLLSLCWLTLVNFLDCWAWLTFEINADWRCRRMKKKPLK